MAELNVLGSITSSQGISASGDLFCDNIILGGDASTIQFGYTIDDNGNIEFSKNILYYDTNDFYIFNGQTQLFHLKTEPNQEFLTLGNQQGGLTEVDLTVHGLITANALSIPGSTLFLEKGNITASGVVSASKFVGDGAGITNVTATAAPSPGTYSSSLQTLGNVTSSGNISASGDLTIFGEVVHLEGTDPRLKLKAKGANHPGIEWHEDSTRKWVLYNDPDESDKLVFKNDTTELLKLTQAGHLGVTEELYHIGDTDTKITFTTDDINITVGGVNMIDFTEGSNDEITINEAAADLDVRIEGEDDANLLFVDASTPGRVGIGTNTPGEKLEVIGNISASGDIQFNTLTGTINGGKF